jgi:hypothetical protein
MDLAADGFIGGPSRELDWHFPSQSPDLIQWKVV